ncbi:YceI family protein [Euzebya rosea]|uniref:YceI family protein n=1 Tax=Euzebya rosea TaxID=2052804 RepID=UPI000D3E8005|nr:YceI family protein [Euzebya rosea]
MNARTLIGGIAALAVVGAGVAVWYLNRPAAEVASIDNALEAVGSDAADATDVTDATDPADGEAVGTAATAVDDVSGTWTVNTDIGTFDFADATSSFVGFRVDEELASVGETEAVGRTPAVTGELVIDGTTLTAATIDADFTAIVSDVPRRDDAMQRAMGVADHPTGTFVLTEPVDFGEVPSAEDRVTFSAVGDLTVNGVTNAVTLDMEAQVADGNILVVGTTPVVFADYDVETPTSRAVVSLEDNGTVEVQLWFSAA